MRLSTLTRGHGALRIGLVHGLGADATTWEPFVEALLERVDATVVAPDLRGHGTSERAGRYDVDAFADDLVENLPADLDLVIGHSLGGAVLPDALAAELAALGWDVRRIPGSRHDVQLQQPERAVEAIADLLVQR